MLYGVIMTSVVTRSGRISKKPERLDPEEEIEDDYEESDYDEDEEYSDDEDLCETDDEEEDDDEDADERQPSSPVQAPPATMNWIASEKPQDALQARRQSSLVQ